jgi:hypothetical protein
LKRKIPERGIGFYYFWKAEFTKEAIAYKAYTPAKETNISKNVAK